VPNGPGLLLNPYTAVVESLPLRSVAFMFEMYPPYGSLLSEASNEFWSTFPGGMEDKRAAHGVDDCSGHLRRGRE